MAEKADSSAWLVLAWRLPTSESSANRVSVWRRLRNLGAVGLTPGAAILPFTEESEEQFDWLAQEIEEHDGDAWVLPVGHLSEAEERKIRERMRADRKAEYDQLVRDAMDFLKQRDPSRPGRFANFQQRERELLALERRYRKIRTRDYFRAPGRREAAQTLTKCLAFRQRVGAGLISGAPGR